MMRAGKSLLLFLSIAVGLWADKKEAPFRPEPMESYTTKMSAQGLTIAVQPFDDPERSKAVFGKAKPYENGVLPVLVVLKNESGKALQLENMEVVYNAGRGRKIDPIPAQDLMYLKGGERPKVRNNPIPSGSPRVKVAKNPLKDMVMIERSFSARMLPPGDSAHGFFYFQTGHARGASIYISGIFEAKTGQELFYFDIPLD